MGLMTTHSNIKVISLVPRFLAGVLCCFLFIFSIPLAWAADQVSDYGVVSRLDDQTSLENPDVRSNPASRGNLGNDVLYYIVVDRFFDANADNNVPDYAFPVGEDVDRKVRAYNDMNRLLLRHGYDPTHRYIGMYWGGDLEGVIQKLDYLKDLGVTKIVLSPIQDNANGVLYSPSAYGYLHLEKDDGQEADPLYSHASSSFHGYWTKDWFEIDEHFRSPQDETGDRYRVFRQLLDEAGERGIGIIMDLTLNHTSPFHYSSLHPVFYPDQIGFWFADNGAIYRHGELVATYWDPANETLDPKGWFHPLRPINFDRPSQEMVENGTLPGGLPDLNQEVPEVANYLLDAVKFWLNFNEEGHQIAGFRLDAVKHVNVKFWQTLENEVLAIRPSAVLIGEYFSAGYRDLGSMELYQKTKGYTLFNFDLSMNARRFFARVRNWDGRIAVLRDLILGKQGHYYSQNPLQRFVHQLFDPAETLEVPPNILDVVADADAKGWVNFVENHDEPRLLTEHPQMSEQAYASLMKFIFVSPGVPMLMYGVESGLAVPYHLEHAGLFGIGGDPFNRQMMIWPGDRPWNDRLYDLTRQLTHLRQNYPVLRYGDSHFLYPRGSKPDKDMFFIREPLSCDAEAEGCTRVLYAYSTGGGEFLVSLDGLAGTRSIHQVENVETGFKAGVFDGLIPVRLEPEESKVFVLE